MAKNFHKCYRLYLPAEVSNLTLVMGKLSDLGDMIFYEGRPILWLSEGKQKKSVISLLKRCGVMEHFVEEITPTQVLGLSNYLEMWYSERQAKLEAKELEAERQQELQQMMQNIEKIKNLIKGGADDGRGNEETRQTQETETG